MAATVNPEVYDSQSIRTEANDALANESLPDASEIPVDAHSGTQSANAHAMNSSITQEMQAPIVIDEEIVESNASNDCVTNFVHGLTPFINSLHEDLDGVGSSPASKDENADNGIPEIMESVKIEERVMKPIRELIYKSFHEPSEGEEGIEYVISQLSTLKLLSEGCSTDLVVRSIGHFLSMSLPPSWLDSMCRWMLDRMQLILLKFFTFNKYCSCYFNCDISSSRLFVLQCALHRRFPLLISEGCASLSRPPVFYGTKMCSLFNDNNYIRCSWRLLQTGASFKAIPLHRSSQTQSVKRRSKKKGGPSAKEESDDVDVNMIRPLTLDCRTLEQEIERDQSKGRLPCVVFASPTDHLQKIRAICDRHGLWLHIEGGSSSLLLAAATQLPKSTRIMMQCADSISCQPFEWFTTSNAASSPLPKSSRKPKITRKQNGGVHVSHSAKRNCFGSDVPGCSSTITFVKEDLRDTPPPSSQFTGADFVMMFPLWHLLVTRSIKQIKSRVDHSLALCQHLREKLLSSKNIFSTTLLSSSMPQIVVFQIAPNINVVDLSSFKLDVNTFHELLVNRCSAELNRLKVVFKLYDDDDDVDSINLNDQYYGSDEDAFSGMGSGNHTHFRFEPLMTNQPESIRKTFINELIQKIVVEINILRRCLELRRCFQDCIAEDVELESVEPATVQTMMIGLGAFRFVPAFFKNEMNSDSVHILNKTLCDELNEMNSDSVTQMYKLSMDLNGIVVIVVNPANMVFEDNCVQDIYSRIRECVKKMHYPQEVMDVMSKAVRSGIERAKDVVQLRAGADYTVDKIVRSVPFVGSVYGWLLPDGMDNGDAGLDSTVHGVGFQFGVGVTNPQISIRAPTPNSEEPPQIGNNQSSESLN